MFHESHISVVYIAFGRDWFAHRIVILGEICVQMGKSFRQVGDRLNDFRWSLKIISNPQFLMLMNYNSISMLQLKRKYFEARSLINRARRSHSNKYFVTKFCKQFILITMTWKCTDRFYSYTRKISITSCNRNHLMWWIRVTKSPRWQQHQTKKMCQLSLTMVNCITKQFLEFCRMGRKTFS